MENFDKEKVNAYPESPQILQYVLREFEIYSLKMIKEVGEKIGYEFEEKLLLQRLRVVNGFYDFFHLYADAKEVIFNNSKE